MNSDEDQNICESCQNCESDIIVNRPQKVTKDLMTRLNRIEGQIKGIQKMVEKGVYCDDVLTQIAAVQSALNSVGKKLLDSHIRTCMVSRLRAGDEEAVQELIHTVGRMM